MLTQCSTTPTSTDQASSICPNVWKTFSTCLHPPRTLRSKHGQVTKQPHTQCETREVSPKLTPLTTERRPRKSLHWQSMARTKHRPRTKDLRYRTTRLTHWMATPHRQLHRRFQSRWLSIKHDPSRFRPRRRSNMVQTHPPDIDLPQQRTKTGRFRTRHRLTKLGRRPPRLLRRSRMVGGSL